MKEEKILNSGEFFQPLENKNRLQNQTLPNATHSIGKLNTFIKTVGHF